MLLEKGKNSLDIAYTAQRNMDYILCQWNVLATFLCLMG